jgi:hypothetical protein
MAGMMSGRWFALTTLALLLLVSAAHVMAATPPSCNGEARVVVSPAAQWALRAARSGFVVAFVQDIGSAARHDGWLPATAQRPERLIDETCIARAAGRDLPRLFRCAPR